MKAFRAGDTTATAVPSTDDIGASNAQEQAGPEANLGPLFTQSSAARVVSFLEEAKREGAEVLLGDCSCDGAVIQPHVLQGCKPGMKIWDRETFGPGQSLSLNSSSLVRR